MQYPPFASASLKTQRKNSKGFNLLLVGMARNLCFLKNTKINISPPNSLKIDYKQFLDYAKNAKCK